MPKLVVLSAGMAGRAYELKVEKTTVGRVEDNTFPIAEPSVSSHHCEILLRGNEVIIRDLDSTNGTFINGEKITEKELKPGQTLRLGQIELRLEGDTAAPPAAKKAGEQSLAMQRGVSLNDLEQTNRPAGFDTTSKGFSKKNNKGNKIFIGAAVVFFLVILVVLVYVFANIK